MRIETSQLTDIKGTTGQKIAPTLSNNKSLLFVDTISRLHETKPSFLYRVYSCVKEAVKNFFGAIYRFFASLFTKKVKDQGSPHPGKTTNGEKDTTSNPPIHSHGSQNKTKQDGNGVTVELTSINEKLPDGSEDEYELPSLSSLLDSQKEEIEKHNAAGLGPNRILAENLKDAQYLIANQYDTEEKISLPIKDEKTDKALKKIIDSAKKDKNKFDNEKKEALDRLSKVIDTQKKTFWSSSTSKNNNSVAPTSSEFYLRDLLKICPSSGKEVSYLSFLSLGIIAEVNKPKGIIFTKKEKEASS